MGTRREKLVCLSVTLGASHLRGIRKCYCEREPSYFGIGLGIVPLEEPFRAIHLCVVVEPTLKGLSVQLSMGIHGVF